jgi:hypothetical protein
LGDFKLRYIEIDIIGRGKAMAELDERNPKISDAIYKLLPVEARANLWGEEIYFEISLEMENENPSPGSTSGDISYWSPGPAFCIFFGRTQPYSPVNHVGRVVEGLEVFRDVKEGDRIVLNRK